MEEDKPHVILLMVGNIAIQIGWSVQQTKDDLEELVKMVQANHPKIHLVVAQMTPFSWYVPEVVAYNDWIRNVMTPKYAAQGMRITTVDQYSPLLRPGGTVQQIDMELFAGGHHLRPTGYDKMAAAWFERIEQIFPRVPVSIVSMSSANGRLQATYSGAPKGIYELERVTELGGQWVKIGPAVVADANGLFTLNDPAPPAAHCFYRIADPYK